MKIPQQLQRIHPSFHPSGFIAKESRARAHSTQKLPWPRGARRFQRASCFFRRFGERSDRSSRRHGKEQQNPTAASTQGFISDSHLVYFAKRGTRFPNRCASAHARV